MWHGAKASIAESDAARFRARRLELGLGPLVIHANYLINLASSDRVIRARSIDAFRGEILRGLALGANCLVVHPGCAVDGQRERAAKAVAEALREAAEDTGVAACQASGLSAGLRILLENTAGMGSSVGTRFEDLRAILDEAPELPLGVCIDTAHAFEAGYAIHTAAGLEHAIEELDRTIGLHLVPVIHVNDSKTPFGSRVDRHAHIGRGGIGLEGFRRILTHSRLVAGGATGLAGRTFILETPIDKLGDDRRNVRTVWRLAGFDVKQAPRAKNGFSMLSRPRRTESAPKLAERRNLSQSTSGSRKAAKIAAA